MRKISRFKLCRKKDPGERASTRPSHWGYMRVRHSCFRASPNGFLEVKVKIIFFHSPSEFSKTSRESRFFRFFAYSLQDPRRRKIFWQRTPWTISWDFFNIFGIISVKVMNSFPWFFVFATSVLACHVKNALTVFYCPVAQKIIHQMQVKSTKIVLFGGELWRPLFLCNIWKWAKMIFQRSANERRWDKNFKQIILYSANHKFGKFDVEILTKRIVQAHV